MKKIIFLLAIAAFIISCNDPKDPPPDWLVKRFDSIKKVEALQKQSISKN